MLEWYYIFKFLHVGAAILWLGGGLLMVIIAVAADRARNDKQLVDIVLQVAWAAERVYVPASIATLVFGILTVIFGQTWNQLWVILGLLGIASTIFLGVAILTPRAKAVKAAADAGGATPVAVSVSREILTVAKFDMVVLYVIVADMVFKPQFSDWLTLLIFVVVVAAAGYFFLYPMMNKARTA